MYDIRMNQPDLYRLGSPDIIKGAVVAVLSGAIVAIGTVLHGVIAAPGGFDLFMVDWVTLGRDLVNNTIVGAEGALGAYLIKNFFSDSNGAVFGRWGGVN